MPESGTKLSGIAAWAEAWRASDSAGVAALGEQLASTTDPDEIRRLALQWASSDRRTERALGRSLLHGLADEAGGEEEAKFRQLVPWHVALNAGVVPTAESGDFVICLAAGPLSNVAFSLLMAHARRPVQIVDVSETQFWSAFAQLYISVVPAPLREQLLTYRPGEESGTAMLFPASPEVEPEASAPETAEEVFEAVEPPAEEIIDVTEFVTVADEPAQPLWERFSIEEMRSLRACPVTEGPDGVEFLVAAPADTAAQARLSDMVGGAAKITIVSLAEVNAAWREQFGEDIAPGADAVPESGIEALIEQISDGEEAEILLDEVEAEEEEATSEAVFVEPVEPVEEFVAESEPVAEEEPVAVLPPDPELERLVEEVANEDDGSEGAVIEIEDDDAALAEWISEEAPAPVAEEQPPAAPAAPDPAAVALVPSGLAWFARACPYRLEGDSLVCWVTEPYDETLLAAVERRSGRSLLVEPMPADDVMQALIAAYGHELAGVIEPTVAASPNEPEPEPTGGVAVAEPEAVEETAPVDEAQVAEVEEPPVTEPEATLDVLAKLAKAPEPPVEEETEPEAVAEPQPEEPKLTWEDRFADEIAQDTVQVTALDQLLQELALEPPVASVDQDWRPKANEPEFLTTDFAVPPKIEEAAEIDDAEVPVAEQAPVAEEETASVVEVAEEGVIEEPAAEVAIAEEPTTEPAEVEPVSGQTPEAEPEPAVAEVIAPVDPVKEPVQKTEEAFTTEATDEARAAWDEFMKGTGQAKRAEAHVDAVMSRLNREIALDEVAANAVEGGEESGEEEITPVVQEAEAWTQEEVEEARIGQRHADSVQRLMGHSTMPSADILARLGRHLAFEHRIVPVTIEEGTMHVIAAIPLAPATVREISHEVGMPLQVHLGSTEAVDRLLARAYPEADDDEQVQLQVMVKEGRKQEEAAQQSWLEKLMNRVNKSG
jgi:hypothetical protein